MPEQESPAPPEDLGEPGRTLWDAVVSAYGLRPDELRVLGHACREEDLIARMSAEAASMDLVAKGYNGQPVPAPLIPELRQHRATFASLMKQLKLPDLDAEGDGERSWDRSVAARKAAHARWHPKTGS